MASDFCLEDFNNSYFGSIDDNEIGFDDGSVFIPPRGQRLKVGTMEAEGFYNKEFSQGLFDMYSVFQQDSVWGSNVTWNDIPSDRQGVLISKGSVYQDLRLLETMGVDEENFGLYLDGNGDRIDDGGDEEWPHLYY
jgi:hypothetical protein